MTIAAMDREWHKRQIVPAQSLPHPCFRRCQWVGDGHWQQFVATVAWFQFILGNTQWSVSRREMT